MASLNVFKALKRFDFTNNLMQFSHKNIYKQKNLSKMLANGGENIKKRFHALVDSINDNQAFIQKTYNPENKGYDASIDIEPAPVFGGQGNVKILSMLSPNLRIRNKWVAETDIVNHKIAEQPYYKVKDFYGLDRNPDDFSVELLSSTQKKEVEVHRVNTTNQNFVDLQRRLNGMKPLESNVTGVDRFKAKAGVVKEKLTSDKRRIDPSEWEELTFNGLKGDEIVTEADFLGMIDHGGYVYDKNTIAIPEVRNVVKEMAAHKEKMFEELVASGELVDIRKMGDDELVELYTKAGINEILPENPKELEAFFKAERKKADIAIKTYMHKSFLAPKIRKNRADFEKRLTDHWYGQRMERLDLRQEALKLKKDDIIKAINEATGEAPKGTKEELIAGLSDEEMEMFRETIEAKIRTHLEEAATQTAKRIMHDPVGLFSGGKDKHSGKPMPLHRRVMDIPVKKIWDYIEHDPIRSMKKWDSRVIPWLHMKKAFDGKDFDTVLKELDKKFDDVLRKNPKQQKEIEATRRNAIDDLRHEHDRIMGINRYIDPSALFSTITSAALKMNQIRWLLQRVPSSLPDIVRPSMVWGFRPMFETMRAAMMDFSVLKGERFRNTDLGIGAEIITGHNMDRVDDAFAFGDMGTLAERAVNKIHEPFGIMSMGNIWDSWWKQYTGITVANEIIKIARRVKNGGKVSEWESIRLNHLGLGSTEKLIKIADGWEAHGELVAGRYHLARLDKWVDAKGNRTQIADDFLHSLSRDVDEIIVSKREGIASKWTDKSNLGRLGNQFKTYMWNASQMVYLSGLQQADMRFVLNMMAMAFFGGVAHVAKAKLNGYEIDYDNQAELFINAVERSGTMAWIFDINMILERASQGNIGISPLLGGAQLSRYAKRDLVGALLGPSHQRLQELGDVTGGISAFVTGNEVEPYQKGAMERNIFYSNAMHIRLAGSAFREGVEKNTGVRFND